MPRCLTAAATGDCRAAPWGHALKHWRMHSVARASWPELHGCGLCTRPQIMSSVVSSAPSVSISCTWASLQTLHRLAALHVHTKARAVDIRALSLSATNTCQTLESSAFGKSNTYSLAFKPQYLELSTSMEQGASLYGLGVCGVHSWAQEGTYAVS